MLAVTAELDKLIALLEAEIPSNPKSSKNQKLQKGLEQNLAKYFRRLERAFPYSKMDGIYNKYVIKESPESEAKDFLDMLLGSFDDSFRAEMAGEMAKIYISGQAEMISYGKTKLGIPIAYEGPPIEDAIKWAEKHGAELVTQMDEETKRRLSNVISNGIKRKRGIPGLTKDIKKSFTDMARYRAKMIARTETANALSQASLDNMKDMGIDGKEVVTGGDPCEICQGNEADGVIPVGQAFSSGHDRPPFHQNCECALAPARLSK